MEEARYVRVVARSKDADQLAKFLRSRVLDLGGRPHRTGDVWQVDFYLPESEADGLSAEGCTFHVDRTFFDRLQKARQDEEARRLSPDELKRIIASGRFPSRALDDPDKRGGRK